MSTGTNTFSASTHAIGLAITSDAAADGFAGYYKSNDVVRFSLTFSEAVTVVGSPRLQIDVGGELRSARFLGTNGGGSGTDTLHFAYTIGFDNDANGISVPANALVTNGALIRDMHGQTIDMTTPALGDAIDHKVDVVRPGTPTMNDIAGDHFISADELGSLQITGTADAGSTVNLAFDSGFTRKILVPADGQWSYHVTEADLLVMGLGREYITATVTDAAGNAAVYQTQRTVIVEALTATETPLLISGPSGAPGQALSEDRVNENTSQVHVFSASETVTWSLGGGADQALFQIDANTGALAFASAPDFEHAMDMDGDNRYVVIVRATSASGRVSQQEVTIAVDDVNDFRPQITSAAVVSHQENSSGPAYVVTALDQDSPGGLTYAMAGVDANLFLINATTGIVTFRSAPDFETPTDADRNNRYEIVVTASDGVQTSVAWSVGIDVSDVLEVAGGVGAGPALRPVALDNQTSVDVRTRIVLDFDQDVSAVAGKFIRIVDDGGAGFRGENISNAQVLEAIDARVSIAGGRVVIDPQFDLDFSSNYHVEIDAGALVGAGNALAFAGINNATTVNFSTVAPAAGGTAGAASVIADASGAMVASMLWWDISGLGNPFGPAKVLSSASGSHAYVVADYVTAAANPEDGYDGVGVADFNVKINQFGSDDLLYVDNRGANTSINATSGTVMIDNVTFTDLLWEAVPRSGGFGGQVQISGLGFETVAGWQAALGAGNAPYVIA